MTYRKTYRAKWLLPDPWTVLENGHVTVVDGIIDTVGTGRPPKDAPIVDLGPGAMIPPLVNAHTHLELSALKDSLPRDKGFRNWTAELIQKRESLTEEALLEGAGKSIEHLLDSGCRTVGEISTLGITCKMLQNSPMAGVFFHEHLGNHRPDTAQLKKSDRLSLSLAVHAPHTSAPDLLRISKRVTSSAGLPMSLHLAESEDESLFIETARGDWADFLTGRNIDFSDWPLPARSPVRYLHALGVLDAGTLAVHLLHCSEDDKVLLQKKSVKVCFCPRSNFLLHGKLPDIPSFLALGFEPSLGTDSLASCPSLSVLDEMAFVMKNFFSISPSDILAMGTVNGAAALGLGKGHGRLSPGCQALPLYIPVSAASARDVPSAIISSGNAKITSELKIF